MRKFDRLGSKLEGKDAVDDHFNEVAEKNQQAIDKEKAKQKEIQEYRKDFVSEKDVEIMKQGLKKLRSELESREPEELPDVLVFPDTSARPLYYLVREVIRDVYKKKKKPVPQISFFPIFADMEQMKDYVMNVEALENGDEELSPEMEDEMRELGMTEAEYVEFTAFEAFPKLEGGLNYQKLNSTQHYLEGFLTDLVKEKKKAFFIDDYIYRGRSLIQINEAIKSAEAEEELPNIDFFTFYRDLREGKDLATELEKVNIISGSESFEAYSGFEYRHNLGFSPEKTRRYQKEKESILGVRKKIGEKSSVRVKYKFPEGMKKLRKIMSDLGKEFK